MVLSTSDQRQCIKVRLRETCCSHWQMIRFVNCWRAIMPNETVGRRVRYRPHDFPRLSRATSLLVNQEKLSRTRTGLHIVLRYEYGSGKRKSDTRAETVFVKKHNSLPSTSSSLPFRAHVIAISATWKKLLYLRRQNSTTGAPSKALWVVCSISWQLICHTKLIATSSLALACCSGKQKRQAPVDNVHLST